MRNFQHLGRHFAIIVTLFALLFSHNAFGQESAVKVIVLDAGHGGRFVGAAIGSICEKDINLQVVLKLGALLNKKMPNVKVVYTRTTDKHFSENLGVDLQARANIAHKNNADLFISVHSNAMPNKPEVKGTVTLIMGETTNEINRNNTALYNNNKEELLDMSDQKTATIVRAYIQNLQYTYGAYSQMMGRFIQDEYKMLGYRDLGVRGQPLKVLYSTDMPSVLTEIGFMTNPDEFRYITSEAGQEQIVGALYRAIARYIEVVNRSILVDKPSHGKTAKSEEATTNEAAHTSVAEVAKPEVKSAPVAVKEGIKEEHQTKTPAAQPQSQTKPQTATTKRYTIQIMSGNDKISLDNAYFKSLRGKIWILNVSGVVKYKYCYGDFADKASAQSQLDAVHKEFPNAFILPYNK